MQAMWQQPFHSDFVVMGKNVGKDTAAQKATLPLPLTEENVRVCLAELNTGTRRAVETCIECFQNNRMSKDDLLCFMQSIASQGKTLKQLFANGSSKTLGEKASHEDLSAMRALSRSASIDSQKAGHVDTNLVATSAQFGDTASEQELSELRALASFATPHPPLPSKQGRPVCVAVHGSDMAPPAVATRPNALPTIEVAKPKPTRVRRAKVSEPTDEEKALMAWWSERRIPEVFRRQVESCDHTGRETDEQKRIAYLRHLFTQLQRSLPAAGKAKLLALLSSVNASGNDVEFAGAIKDIVDEFDVKISLSYAPECTVRRQKKSRLRGGQAALAMDEDEWSEQAEHAPTPVKAEARKEDDSKEPLKRKRTETLKGAEPKVDGEEDEDARCPVCVGCPQDDDRWVKCDGCSSWYHQICVLFNEQAHGKSVRFFCRTPGCRKRGSRQLNRRQRKPCYPSSPGLEASNLGERLSRFSQQFARVDRTIVVKMVASQAHVREVRRGRAVEEETVQSKTLLCFQHTMIGSDLLFLVLFVHEIRAADGSSRVEISHIDSNGLYEGMEPGERERVEGAVVVGYLEHAADCGFRAASIVLRDTSSEADSLFYARPQGTAWGSLAEAQRFMGETLTEARTGGLVHSFGAEGAGGEAVMRVQLNSSKAQVEAMDVDGEMRSVVASTPAEWRELMAGNNYRFDSLQFAKFSSMMLVYHVIKGSKRDTSRGAALSSTPLPSHDHGLLHELSDDDDDADIRVQTKRMRTACHGGPPAPPASNLKRDEPAPAPPQPQPQQHAPGPLGMFESPCVRASSAFMPSPMVRYSLFSGPTESPAIRSSAFPGALESPAIRSSAFRGPGESPATGSSLFRGPGESPATGSSLFRGPGESPATGSSLFRGPGESPAVGSSMFRNPLESPAIASSVWRGPMESPAIGSSLWRDSPATRPLTFPGESPATRPVAFPGPGGESPAARPISFPGESPGIRSSAFPGPLQSPIRGSGSFFSPGMVSLRPPKVPSLGEEKGGQADALFSVSDAMLEDVIEPALGSAFSAESQQQDPFWDNFLSQLQQ